MNDDAEDQSDVDENADGHLPPDVGRGNDEFGEDDPQRDGDEQEGTLGN